MSDLVRQLVEQACENMVAQRDAILSALITERLGEGWTLEQLRGRCELVIAPGAPQRAFLDGQLLAEFYPVEHVVDGGHITLVQNWRRAGP